MDSPMKSAVLPDRVESGELGQMAPATDDVWRSVLDKVVPCCVVLKGEVSSEIPRCALVPGLQLVLALLQRLCHSSKGG